LVTALTLLSGAVSGAFANRWGTPSGAKLSAAHIAEVPESFGDWQLQSELPIEPDVIEMLQCSGNLHRLYRNRETGQVVNVVLFLGPPGPISAHTPEVCYSTRDYDQLGAPRRHNLQLSRAVECAVPSVWDDESANSAPKTPDPRSEATVWRMKFRSSTLAGETLSVAYAWNCGEGWVAPDSPRIVFAGRPMLYKLQLSGVVDSQLAGDPGDPCESFLEAFLPVCETALFDN
jgi:hypothetical protein